MVVADAAAAAVVGGAHGGGPCVGRGGNRGGGVAAAVVAGAHKDYAAAQKKMTGLKPTVYKPNAKAHATYTERYALYKQLHDAFGTKGGGGNLHGVMKKLIEIRSRSRK